MAGTTPRPQLPGGFLPPSARSQTLPSPAPSTASSRAAARLPAPRSKPLAPGSRKEDYARDYVAQRLLHVSRRFVKKHGISAAAAAAASAATADDNSEDDDEKKTAAGTGGAKGEEGIGKGEKEVPGYESADQMCADLEEVVDVLWFSGTPSLQIPYLINVASALTTYLSSFPPSPRPTFALLQKLDHCFASLLVGHDVKTRNRLPGFQTPGASGFRAAAAAGLSRTDMVRVKSIADETRRLVAAVMSGEADVEFGDDEDGEDDDDSAVTGLRQQRARGRDTGRDYDQILDPFVEEIDPGEGVVYRLKPEAAYGGFVADEETDDEDEDDFAAAGGAANIKLEEEEGGGGEYEDDEEEEEDDEFVDVAQPKIIPKRKVDDDVDLLEQEADDGDPKKRLKAEEEQKREMKVEGGNKDDGTGAQIKGKEEDKDEEGDTPIPDQQPQNIGDSNGNSSSTRAPARPPATTADSSNEAFGLKDNSNNNNNNNNTTINTGNVATQQQQFHFALDEEDDEEEEGETLPNTTTTTTTTTTTIANTAGGGGGYDDGFGYGDGDDNYEVVTDEEEEELHMNVAKVYEKTLVQLGKSDMLGESSIVDS